MMDQAISGWIRSPYIILADRVKCLEKDCGIDTSKIGYSKDKYESPIIIYTNKNGKN